MRRTHNAKDVPGERERLADLAALDLNLLLPLVALLEERHITRAAARCNLSQPAMSRSLERLREAFADDLLIRVGPGYELSARARELLDGMLVILPRLASVVRSGDFRPVDSTHHFRLATTDYGATVLAPAVAKRLARVAAGVRLDVLQWYDSAANDMAAGRIDVAIVGRDAIPDLSCEPYVEDEFVCVVARRHPVRGKRFTLRVYAHYPHVAISARQSRQPWLEEVLSAKGLQRRVVLATPFGASAVLAVAQTQALLTIPRRMAMALAKLGDVRVVGAPREFERARYVMAWHPRVESDAAQIWFRDQLRDLAKSLVGRERRA
jgi:DNA-binding transcriptional LysR family regulator